MNLSFFKKGLVKETFVYTITDVIGKAMSFILLPFVSFYLPPDELGIATNFTVLAGLIVLLAGVAVINSIPYFFYEQTKEDNNLMISNLMMLCSILCAVIVLFFLSFSSIVFKYTQLDLQTQLLSILFVLGSLITQTSLTILRLENKAHHFAYLQIFQIILHALLVVALVIWLKGGGLGKIYAEVMVFVIMGLVHLCLLIKKNYLKMSFDISWMKKLVKFGLPLLPHSISFWFKGGTDKIFITTYCGLQYNGLYSMALSICSVYTMLTGSFFNAYTPYLQKRLVDISDSNEREEKKKIIRQIYLIVFLFFMFGIISVFGCWIIFNYFIDSKYLPAFDFVIYIIFAYFIYTFYSFAIQFIYKKKKTLIMGAITFTGSVIQMMLSYYLIRTIGVMGAAYSLIIGNLLITLGIMIYSNRVYKMPWISR